MMMKIMTPLLDYYRWLPMTANDYQKDYQKLSIELRWLFNPVLSFLLRWSCFLSESVCLTFLINPSLFPRSNNFCYPGASKTLKQSPPPALGQGCSLPLGGRIWEAPKGCLLILGQILESPPQIPVKLSSLGLRLSLLLFYVVTNIIFKGDFLPWHSAPRKKGKEGGGRKDLRTCCYTSPIQYTASTNPSHCLCCHQVVTRW